MNVAQSWGKFANTVEELMDDLVERSALLVNTFGLETSIHSQLLTFNTTFLVGIPFLLCYMLLTIFACNRAMPISCTRQSTTHLM